LRQETARQEHCGERRPAGQHDERGHYQRPSKALPQKRCRLPLIEVTPFSAYVFSLTVERYTDAVMARALAGVSLKVAADAIRVAGPMAAALSLLVGQPCSARATRFSRGSVLHTASDAATVFSSRLSRSSLAAE